MDQQALFLATIQAALKVQPAGDPLSALQVNQLGQRLGLAEGRIFELVRQLESDGNLHLEWGGRVALAPQKPTPQSINLGPNATFVGQGFQIGAGAAVGAGAMAAGAVRIERAPQAELTQIVATLTTALECLATCSAGLLAEHQQARKELSEHTEAIQQELRCEKPDKEKVTPRLEQAEKVLGILEKATKIGSAAASALPHVLELLRQGYQSLSAYLGGA